MVSSACGRAALPPSTGTAGVRAVHGVAAAAGSLPDHDAADGAAHHRHDVLGAGQLGVCGIGYEGCGIRPDHESLDLLGALGSAASPVRAGDTRWRAVPLTRTRIAGESNAAAHTSSLGLSRGHGLRIDAPTTFVYGRRSRWRHRDASANGSRQQHHSVCPLSCEDKIKDRFLGQHLGTGGGVALVVDQLSVPYDLVVG